MSQNSNNVRLDNLEKKITDGDSLVASDVADKKNRDVIVSVIADKVGKNKDGYIVTMELRQDGKFGIDNPYADANLINYEHNGETKHTTYISKSQYDAIREAAGDNAVQDGKATRMAVSGHLMNCKSAQRGDMGIMLNPKTVKAPTVSFDEDALKDHRNTINQNKKDAADIEKSAESNKEATASNVEIDKTDLANEKSEMKIEDRPPWIKEDGTFCAVIKNYKSHSLRNPLADIPYVPEAHYDYEPDLTGLTEEELVKYADKVSEYCGRVDGRSFNLDRTSPGVCIIDSENESIAGEISNAFDENGKFITNGVTICNRDTFTKQDFDLQKENMAIVADINAERQRVHEQEAKAQEKIQYDETKRKNFIGNFAIKSDGNIIPITLDSQIKDNQAGDVSLDIIYDLSDCEYDNAIRTADYHVENPDSPSFLKTEAVNIDAKIPIDRAGNIDMGKLRDCAYCDLDIRPNATTLTGETVGGEKIRTYAFSAQVDDNGVIDFDTIDKSSLYPEVLPEGCALRTISLHNITLSEVMTKALECSQQVSEEDMNTMRQSMEDNRAEFDEKFNADDPRAFYEEQYKKVIEDVLAVPEDAVDFDYEKNEEHKKAILKSRMDSFDECEIGLCAAESINPTPKQLIYPRSKTMTDKTNESQPFYATSDGYYHVLLREKAITSISAGFPSTSSQQTECHCTFDMSKASKADIANLAELSGKIDDCTVKAGYSMSVDEKSFRKHTSDACFEDAITEYESHKKLADDKNAWGSVMYRNYSAERYISGVVRLDEHGKFDMSTFIPSSENHREGFSKDTIEQHKENNKLLSDLIKHKELGIPVADRMAQIESDKAAASARSAKLAATSSFVGFTDDTSEKTNDNQDFRF